LAAVDDGCAFARIKIEGNHRRGGQVGVAVQERVDLDAADGGSPAERFHIGDADVANDSGLMFPWNRKGPYPLRCKGRSILLPERFPLDVVRIPLQGHRPIKEVRQQDRSELLVRGAQIVRCEPCAGKENTCGHL
jgi:hypothetical protein